MASEDWQGGIGGASQGAAAGSVFGPPGAIIGGVAGGIGGMLSARSDRKRRQRNESAINAAYNQAGELTSQGFRDARRMYGDTATRARGIYDRGFDEQRDILSSGYEKGRGELESGFKEAKGAYDVPEQMAIRSRLLDFAMGQGGGYDKEAVEGMKSQVGDTYASQARDLVRESKGFAGMSQAPGLQFEQLAEGFGRLGQRKSEDLRDIDFSQAQAQREDRDTGMRMLIQHADKISSMAERFGEMASRMTIDEAVSQGALTGDEMNTLATLEVSLGESLAGLTLQEAFQKAELVLGRNAALMGQQRPSGGFSQFMAPLAQTGLSQAIIQRGQQQRLPPPRAPQMPQHTQLQGGW